MAGACRSGRGELKCNDRGNEIATNLDDERVFFGAVFPVFSRF